jgi:hypothetical protein
MNPSTPFSYTLLNTLHEERVGQSYQSSEVELLTQSRHYRPLRSLVAVLGHSFVFLGTRLESLSR